MTSNAWRSSGDKRDLPFGFLQQQIVGDEELGHRRGAEDLGVAIGDQLVGGAIEDGDREGGASGGGFVGGLLDACLQSAEPGVRQCRRRRGGVLPCSSISDELRLGLERMAIGRAVCRLAGYAFASTIASSHPASTSVTAAMAVSSVSGRARIRPLLWSSGIPPASGNVHVGRPHRHLPRVSR